MQSSSHDFEFSLINSLSYVIIEHWSFASSMITISQCQHHSAIGQTLVITHPCFVHHNLCTTTIVEFLIIENSHKQFIVYVTIECKVSTKLHESHPHATVHGFRHGKGQLYKFLNWVFWESLYWWVYIRVQDQSLL